MDGSEVDRSLASLVMLSTSLSCAELIAAIPLEPDRSWEKGAPRGKHGSTHRYSGISFSSRVDRAAEPGLQAQDLLDRLKPVASAVRAFAEQASEADPETTAVRFWVDYETTTDERGIDLRNEQVRAIADLGAALGVNIDRIRPVVE
jgi:hypothetical protein